MVGILPAPGGIPSVHLKKAWHGLRYLLTGIWDEDEEELREEYVPYFQELKQVIAQASAARMGLLVILS